MAFRSGLDHSWPVNGTSYTLSQLCAFYYILAESKATCTIRFTLLVQVLYCLDVRKGVNCSQRVARNVQQTPHKWHEGDGSIHGKETRQAGEITQGQDEHYLATCCQIQSVPSSLPRLALDVSLRQGHLRKRPIFHHERNYSNNHVSFAAGNAPPESAAHCLRA